MGLSGISQAGALRELSFSISASRVKLLPPEAEHRTPFVIRRLDLCLSRDPRWGSSRSCKQERHSLVGLMLYSATLSNPSSNLAEAQSSSALFGRREFPGAIGRLALVEGGLVRLS
jgi:hypothetical protein